MDFRIRQLQAFLTLAEYLHYGRTARALYMSQPTMTFQIKSLEHAFGLKLFERDRQQVRLTEAGLALREYAQSIMDTVDAARECLSDIHTRLTLRVSCGPVGQFILLPEVIRALSTNYSKFELEVKELTTEQQMTQLAERKVDALLMIGALPIPGSHFEPLWTESLIALVACHSPLAKRATVSVQDLRHTSVIASRSKDCRFHQPFLHALLAPYGITPKIVEAPQSCSVQFAYAASGAGMAIATQSTAMYNFPGVVAIPFAEPLPVVQLGLITLKSNESKALTIFRNVVAECSRRVLGTKVDAGAKASRTAPHSVVEFPGAPQRKPQRQEDSVISSGTRR